MVWGSEISVDVCDDDKLMVFGKLPLGDSDIERQRDPHLRYLASVKSQFAQEGTGGSSPHILFANATTTGALIDFVRQYGPFAASAVAKVEPPESDELTLDQREQTDWRTSVCAVQDLATLERERQTYAAALGLLAELNREKAQANVGVIQREVSLIAKGVGLWPQQCSKERQWRASHHSGSMAWNFNSDSRDIIENWTSTVSTTAGQGASLGGQVESPFWIKPRRVGHLVLCELINSFRTVVQPWGKHRIDALPFGSLIFGVRPVLYLILKRAYLGRGGAQICGNDRCASFFEVERMGQRFCSSDCSQKSRQRQYWIKSGSLRRRKRRRAVKTTTRKTKR
jgi:hypothetical protein